MITLVYGTAFGMVLVLLLVPAIIAIQSDVARQTASLRRALRSKPRELRGVMLAGAVAISALFAATLGYAALTGNLPGPLAALALASPMPTALVLFIAGSLLIVLLLYAMVAIRHAMRRQPAEQP